MQHYRHHSHLSSQSCVHSMQIKNDKTSMFSLCWMYDVQNSGKNWKLKNFTWCPEQIVPFGILALNGLCTGQDERGPHREEGPGNGTELKLFGWLLQGLHNGGGGKGPCSDVMDGPCANIDRWGIGICIEPPGPGPWWHICPPQFGIGHCPPLFIPWLLQYGSTVKLSWLPEHFRCNVGGGGDDCRE